MKIAEIISEALGPNTNTYYKVLAPLSVTLPDGSREIAVRPNDIVVSAGGSRRLFIKVDHKGKPISDSHILNIAMDSLQRLDQNERPTDFVKVINRR